MKLVNRTPFELLAFFLAAGCTGEILDAGAHLGPESDPPGGRQVQPPPELPLPGGAPYVPGPSVMRRLTGEQIVDSVALAFGERFRPDAIDIDAPPW